MRASRIPRLVIALIFLAICLGRSAAPGQEDVQESLESGDAQAPEPSQNWQRELDAIADLLIDGKSAQARERAGKLLETQDLPDSVAVRARELQQKAEMKLAATSASPEPKKETASTGENEKRERTEPTFNVRIARIGSGFDAGTSCLLRISETGLEFSRKGQSREDWTIRWRDLVEAREDDGLWDTPYPPVVLVERGGRRHYLAQVDAKGRHLPGGPLLAAIAEGRRRQKTLKPAAGNSESASSEEVR